MLNLHSLFVEIKSTSSNKATVPRFSTEVNGKLKKIYTRQELTNEYTLL